MTFAAVSAIAMMIFPLLSGYITGGVLKEWTPETMKQLFWAGGAMAVLIVVCLLYTSRAGIHKPVRLPNYFR